MELIIGIIVVGYNRTDSVKRLLERLNACAYPHSRVPLVVSLDNCGKTDVFDCASAFDWTHGTKEVILQPERMGCKNHILHCGDYIERFGWDAAVVLEDDVYPSAAFYQYSLQAVEKYQNDDRIAGISLYSMPQNQTVRLPFAPVLSEYDAYFMQLAQSCGQVWMRRQWRQFADWYAQNSAPFRKCPGVPANVCRWPETSWLKYHIRYCVETEKYFSYPYQALTTNFSDVGEHTIIRSRVLQTHLQHRVKEQYCFPDLETAPIIYDAWHENRKLPEHLGLDPEQTCVDIAGGKRSNQEKRWWLTTLRKPYTVEASYALELYPMDMNVLCDLSGHEIFLYDTAKPDESPAHTDRDLQMWSYFNRILYPDEMIWKLSKPIGKRVWKSRRKKVLHPVSTVKTFLKKRKNRRG